METMLIRDVCRIMEQFAPLSLQESYDNCGLLIGDYSQELRGVLLCIDVTESVIDEAIEKKCNMIVSHHPLIFGGLTSITGCSEVERCIQKAIKYDIAIYAAHTTFDNVVGGVSFKMAEKLCLRSCRILCPKQAYKNAGYGVVGELNEEMDEIDFLTLVSQVFGAQHIRHTRLLRKKIKKVALCGGSGADFIPDAKHEKVDVYLTADLKYHDFFSAENQLLIIDIGHFETEQFTKELFFEQLIKKIPKFALHFSQVVTNPVKYL